MNRNEIEERYKWNLSIIYNNIDDFNKDYNEAKQRINLFS